MKYFGTEEVITVRKRQVRGLNLPERVLERFYRGCAERWYPGI